MFSSLRITGYTQLKESIAKGIYQGSHSHGKSWKKVESHGKVMKNSKKKIQNVMEICLPKKVMEKSWKSVVQIRLIVFLLCCDQCGSRLNSSVSLITTIVLHLCYTYT